VKRFFRVFSLFVIFCLMVTPLSALAASVESISFEDRVQQLAQEYGVTISVSPTTRGETVLTAAQEEAELAELEARLAAGQAALVENNRQAEEAWQAVVDAGRLTPSSLVQDSASSRATHTVYRFQTIGSYYPNGTTIMCYITANKVYSDYHSRNLWGSVVTNGSVLYSGMGTDWEETDCKIQRIDGGRTLYVQVWGDLEEKYTSWFVEYTITSEGWRLWYEAYCPA